MNKPAVYIYRKIDGVLMPAELDPRQDDQRLITAAKFRQERRGYWKVWAKHGLPLPDPDSGKCGIFKGLDKLPADLDLIQPLAPARTASAAD